MHVLIPTLLACGATSASAIAAEKPQPYVVTAHIVAVRSDDRAKLALSSTDGPARFENSAYLDPLEVTAYKGIPEVWLGDERLILMDDGGLEVPEGASAEVVSSPRITTLPHQRASLRSGLDGPLEYFERVEDGSYRVVRGSRDEIPRVVLDVTAAPGDDAGTVTLTVGLAITVMTGREPLEGTQLDVGRPILESREVGTVMLRVPLGAWRLVSALVAQPENVPYSQYLLVFFRVDGPPDR